MLTRRCQKNISPHCMMEWTAQQEEFLRRLHFESHTLAEYNRRQFRVYSRIHQRFTIPILVISGTNSLFAVSTQAFLERDLISITNACLSLFRGILGSIQMFMKVDSKIHQSVICAHEFQKLLYRTSRELSVERMCVPTRAKSLLQKCSMSSIPH